MDDNFYNTYPGKKLKEIIWKTSKSTYPQAWEQEIREKRIVNEDAYTHMLKTPLRF